MATSHEKDVKVDDLVEVVPSPVDEKSPDYHAEPKLLEGVDDTPIIVTGADAAAHLLPMRDDRDPALTFRGIVLATVLSGFQAVMTQIYYFKPTQITIGGTFIVRLFPGWDNE